MLGGNSYKEPPKWFYNTSKTHSGDEIDGNTDDAFRCVEASPDGNTFFGFALDDNPTSNQGAIYEFKLLDGVWTETARIADLTTTSVGSQFGFKAKLRGQKLFISAPYDDDNGTNSGAIYIYESGSSGWQQVDKISHTDTSDVSGDLLGYSLDVSEAGDLIFAGARIADPSSNGSVYVFQSGSSGWQQVQEIKSSNTTGGIFFGTSLSYSEGGKRLVVGAPRFGSTQIDSSFRYNSGGAFLYESGSSGWQQVGTEFAPTETINPKAGEMGTEVFINRAGTIIAASAPTDASYGTRTGAVHVWISSSEGWQHQVFMGQVNDAKFGIGLLMQSRYSVERSYEDYLFVGSGWKGQPLRIYKCANNASGQFVEFQSLPNPAPAAMTDFFARPIVVSQQYTRLFASATGDSQEASKAGAVKIYDFSDEY